MNIISGKKYKRYTYRMVTLSSIKNRANMISNPMGQKGLIQKWRNHDRYKG